MGSHPSITFKLRHFLSAVFEIFISLGSCSLPVIKGNKQRGGGGGGRGGGVEETEGGNKRRML